jgi:hypothetical protein
MTIFVRRRDMVDLFGGDIVCKLGIGAAVIGWCMVVIMDVTQQITTVSTATQWQNKEGFLRIAAKTMVIYER